MIQDLVNSVQCTDQKDQIQKEVASKISVELEKHIMKASDSAKDTIVEDYFRNIDQRVNLKIAASMKKAVHLLVEKFDILIQNRFELILSKQVQDEVDKKIRTLKLQSSPRALCAKCKSLARRETLIQSKHCSNCNSDIKKKSPTAKQIRFKVQKRVEKSIEHHQVRLQSPRARYGNKYPYKSPNRFFESQESSIRSLEHLQFSQESIAANFQSRSPNRHKCSSPIADASFCSSDKACPYSKKGVPHLEHNCHHHHILPCGGIIVEKCSKRPKTSRLQNPSNEKKKKSLSKESKRTVSKERETRVKKLKNYDNLPRLQKVNQVQSNNKSKHNQGLTNKTARQVDSNIAKRQREAKMKRNASKASLGESQPRQTPSKKGNDTLKQKQEEFIQKLPIGYPMELKEDLIDTRLKWVNNNQQVSALFDEIEEIYHEMDPIDESLELRKKYNGFINNYSVVRSKKKEKRKFFFYLRCKLPEQSSLFEVSPVQILNQLSSTQRGEAIMVFDDNDRTNPNIMVPQSSGSSSRVKISGSLSTQKIDRSGIGSIISQQDESVNKDYSMPKSQHPMQTFTDSRKYSDSENIEKQQSLMADKRKPDQVIQSSYSPNHNQNDVQNSMKVNYLAKSNPCSPSHISKQSAQVLEKGSPEKLIFLNQSSQEALIDIQLHNSIQISENKIDAQSPIKQTKSTSPRTLSSKKSKQQNYITEDQQKKDIQQKQIDDSAIITQSSPCLKSMHAVYSPEKHKYMLHTLVQQQSPEKIHFETFQKKQEQIANIKFTSSEEVLTPNQNEQPHLIQFQMCPMAIPEMTVISPQNSPPKIKNEQPNTLQKANTNHQQEKDDNKCQRNSIEQSPQKLPMESPERELPPKPEMISESLPESPQKPPHHMNELIELERDMGFQFYSQDFSMDISQDKIESQTPLNIYKMRSPLLNQEPPSKSPLKPEVCEESAPNSQGQVITAQSVQEEIDKKLDMAEQKEIELSQNIKDSTNQQHSSKSDQSLQKQQTIKSQKSIKISSKEFSSNNSSSEQNKQNISSQPKLIKMVTCMESVTPINSNSRQSRIPSIRRSSIQQLDRHNSSINKLSMKQIGSKTSSKQDQNQSTQSQKLMFSLDHQVQILNDDQSAFDQMQNKKEQSHSLLRSQKSSLRNSEQNQTYPKINGTKKVFNYTQNNMDQLNIQSSKQSEKAERLQYERIINVQAEETEIVDECDLNSQMSVKINISALDIDDQTKYLEELQNVQTTKQRKRSDSKESEGDQQKKTQSRTVKQSVDMPTLQQSPIKLENIMQKNNQTPSNKQNQPAQQQKVGVLNTIQALEKVLNQVKAKHSAHNQQISNRHQKSASTIDNTQGMQENQTVTSNTQHHQTQPSNLLLLSQPTILCSPKAIDKTHTQQAAPPAHPGAIEQDDFKELKQNSKQSQYDDNYSDQSQILQIQENSQNITDQKSSEEQENTNQQQESTPTQIMDSNQIQSTSIRGQQLKSNQSEVVCHSETNQSKQNLLSSMSKLKLTDNSEPFKLVASDNSKSQNELEGTANQQLVDKQDQFIQQDPQLQKMMEQFVEEVVVENLVDNNKKCRKLSQTQMANKYINEIEIDKAINEILENSSFHFNKNEVLPNKQEQRSTLEFEMSLANKTQPEKYNIQKQCENSLSQPFRVDQIEEIRIDQVLNDYGPSSGIESMYRELEKAKLMVETSPRKVQGEHLITFENQHHQSTETIPDNGKTSLKVYQNDKINRTENQQNSLHNHSRKATPLVGGKPAPGFDSMINLKKIDETTQKTSEDMALNADIIQILYKNSFLQVFDIETISKLASEIQKVTYKKNEQIVRFGDISQSYYILNKGKIKVTEYEPKSSPQDLNLEDKITMVKYINKEGFGFGEESVKNFTPHKTSIEAIDNCDFYVIDGFFINEILSKVSQDRNSSSKFFQNKQTIKKNIQKDLDKMSSDEQLRTDSSVHLRFDILQPNLNFLPESFVTESKSSRHRIRAASYCPCKVYHDHHQSDDLLNCNLSAIHQKEQPSVCASQSSIGQNLKDLTYASFIENSQIFGLNLRELSIFGDRVPEGHEKVRIIQKGISQLYWLTASTNSSNQLQFFICSQIPRSISTFPQKVKMLQVEQDFYTQIKSRKDIVRNIFCLESVIQQPTSKDIWKIYKIEQRRDVFKNFQEILFNVTFDQQVAITKVVDVQHSNFYEMVSQKKGMRHIAKLVRKVCDFLQLLHDQGIVYGNLRAENILIKLDDDNKEIQQIKFMEFGSVIKMDKASEMLIPDKIEHFPPDLLKNLIEIEKFQKSQNKLIPEHLRLSKRRLNEISESIDVYSLGILLLQIVIGCPLQQQLPLRFKYKTVKGHQYVCQPLLGTIPQQMHLNNVDVKNLISIQESFAQNINFYMQKSDPYRLLQDGDLMRLIQSMVNKDHAKRPTVRMILHDKFLKKWLKVA